MSEELERELMLSALIDAEMDAEENGDESNLTVEQREIIRLQKQVSALQFRLFAPDVSPVPPTAELDWRDFYDRAAKIANTYHEISVMKHGELVEKLPLLENSLSLLNGWMASALSGANADRDHLLAENKRLRNFCTGQTPGISGTPRTITRRFMFPQPLVKEKREKRNQDLRLRQHWNRHQNQPRLPEL